MRSVFVQIGKNGSCVLWVGIMSGKLSNRLRAIAGFIEEGTSVADIGTDHGYLPVHLALSGFAERIIASDISVGSLSAARRSAEKYGVTEKIKFINAPGLDGVMEDEADTIVIAGVGGETMVSILSATPWVKNGKTLVLQPQSKLKDLLNYLAENGFRIMKTRLVQDKGKVYVVLKCVARA